MKNIQKAYDTLLKQKMTKVNQKQKLKTITDHKINENCSHLCAYHDKPKWPGQKSVDIIKTSNSKIISKTTKSGQCIQITHFLVSLH